MESSCVTDRAGRRVRYGAKPAEARLGKMWVAARSLAESIQAYHDNPYTYQDKWVEVDTPASSSVSRRVPAKYQTVTLPLNQAPDPEQTSDRATDKQVGGSHYKDMPIQPVQYIVANGLGFREGNVVKYVSRHRRKNGRQDIEKAIHMLELILDDYDTPEAVLQTTVGVTK